MKASYLARLILLALFAVGCATGCATTHDYVWYTEVPSEQTSPAIAPGDQIQVNVEKRPEMSGQFEVGASGTYIQPIAGPIAIGGKSEREAAALIANNLARFVEAPVVQVTIAARGPVSVTVLGEVRAPGTFTLPGGTGVLAALGSAGGLSEFADEDYIFVLRSTPVAKRIRFRYDDLTKPSADAAKFSLQDGDSILVE